MSIVIVTPNQEEALSIDEVKSYALRVEGSHDDPRIEGLIISARQRFETFCNRYLLETEIDFYLTAFPFRGRIDLPTPLTAVSWIRYVNWSGVEQVMAASDYTVDTRREPGAVWAVYGAGWPATWPQPNAVRIRCIAGWPHVGDVPRPVIDGLYLYISEQYDGQPRDSAYESLWWPYRVTPL